MSEPREETVDEQKAERGEAWAEHVERVSWDEYRHQLDQIAESLAPIASRGGGYDGFPDEAVQEVLDWVYYRRHERELPVTDCTCDQCREARGESGMSNHPKPRLFARDDVTRTVEPGDKHTNGPWVVWPSRAPSEPVHVVEMGQHTVVALLPGEDGDKRWSFGVEHHPETDAFLVAAAPELLEAVETALAWFDRYGYEEGGPKIDSKDVVGLLREANGSARKGNPRWGPDMKRYEDRERP